MTDALVRAIRAALDAKTKPRGSLGRLEDLALDIGIAQKSATPMVDPARIVVFAADHGVTVEGISAFPAEVTAQMVANFVTGGAAVSVLVRTFDAALEVVDVGVSGDVSTLAGVVHDKVARGTANLRVEAAMSHEMLDLALQSGRQAVIRAIDSGTKTLLLGEMGIGNTTSAAVLTGLLCQASADAVTGRGTGVDDTALDLKRRVVTDAMARRIDIVDDPLECLREVGGLEVAALVGVMLEAPAHDLVIVIDGYIVTAAAVVACRLRPAARQQMIFAHRSVEPGHAVALESLSARPLLDLGLRLGEGSGAMLALPLMRAACDVLRDMATFEGADVSAAS